MKLVNFVRMKRAEMRRDGDEGKRYVPSTRRIKFKNCFYSSFPSTAELQTLCYFPMKTFLIYIYRESQRPCIQSAHHQ